MYTIHFHVSGRVQGVFFRAEARRTAVNLGLTGWVRNLSDGCVEGMATGERDQLDEFKEWLAHGPPYAHVKDLEIENVELKEFAKFEIL